LKDNQFELFEEGVIDWEVHSANNRVIFVDAWNSTKDQFINARDAVIGGSHFYYCYFCEGRVFAKKGKGKRRPHFAHYHNGSQCIKRGESVLHVLGKKIIAESEYINAPVNNLSLSEDLKRANYQKIEFQSAELEKLTDGIIPDIKIVTTEEEILVEIVVTHGIDEDKNKKINTTGKRVLEIRLSDYKDKEISVEKLRKIVLDDVSNKSWIHKKNIELGKFIEGELSKLGELKLQVFNNLSTISSSIKEFEIYKFDTIKILERFSPSFDVFKLESANREVILIVQYEIDLISEREMYNAVHDHLSFRGDVHLIDLSEISNDNIINFGIHQLELIKEYIIDGLKCKSYLFPMGRSIFDLWHQYGQKPMILYSGVNQCFLWIRKREFYKHKLMPTILYCKGRVLGVEDFKLEVKMEKQFGLVDGMVSHAENPDWVFYKYPDNDQSITRFFSKSFAR
jgi:hypothetical protein